MHTDVPEFRGANRKVVPQWLLVVMHHSGLFEPWRLHIATGIAWFQDRDHGELRYWPDGPDGRPVVHQVRANTALVLDTDTVFHGVDPGRARASRPRPSSPAPGLTADDDGALGAQPRPTARRSARYDWDDLRFSVSWKAYCFADERRARRLAHRAATTSPPSRSSTAWWPTWSTGRSSPADVAVDRDLGLLLIDEHVRYPAITAFA